MDYDRFIFMVTQRLDLTAESDGARVTRSVLETFAERLPVGETADIASSMPREIDRYMVEAESGQHFSIHEFIERVQERSNVSEEDAVLQANIVIYTASEVILPQELRNARIRLPDEFDVLFQLVDRSRNPPSNSR